MDPVAGIEDCSCLVAKWRLTAAIAGTMFELEPTAEGLGAADIERSDAELDARPVPAPMDILDLRDELGRQNAFEAGRLPPSDASKLLSLKCCRRHIVTACDALRRVG